MNISDTKATLSFSDGSPSVDMPIYKGTIGPDVIDIRKLYGQTGKFTYDPGFMSTASCNSSITYIDGDKGELLYRGYPIEQLAVNCDFLETCYLLLNGELPNAEQKKTFTDTVTKHTMVHEQMQFFFRGFRRDAHPMSVLVGTVGALASFYHDSLDINDPDQREISAIRLIAKLMRETCHEVLNELGLQDDPLFKLAMELERIALEDEYFVSRKLYPNVDFYSGIVQSALGIPVSLFTGIFAMARTIGWFAQWNEMIADPEQKIGRPRQLFVGSPVRDVPTIDKR